MSVVVQQLKRAIQTSRNYSRFGALNSGFKGLFTFSNIPNNNKTTASEKEEDVSLYALNNKIYEIHENAQEGTVVKAKNDVLFFTNFSKSALKLRSLISFKDEPNR